MKGIVFFIFLTCHLFAMFVGNPLNPMFYFDGIITNDLKTFGMRIGYLQEYVYQGKYKDEFLTIDSTNSNNTLSTYAGILTFNFVNRLDVYGILGNSKMQIDRVIFEKRRISWAVGAKAILYKRNKFAIGADIKYFETNPKPDYFLIEGMPAPLITDFSLEYMETQGSVLIGYEGELLSPYIGVTYLFSRITPSPSTGLLDLPNFDMIVDFEIRKAINRKRWGMAIGTSILSSQKMALNLESRLFDQNSVNISGEIRF